MFEKKIREIDSTVWKFHDFSITQIFREIDFWDSTSARSAIWTDLKALNFDFYAFLHPLKAEIRQKLKFRASKCVKITDFALLESPKLISCKIWVIQKSWNFHTVASKIFENLVTKSQCGSFMIYQSLRLYMKSIFGTLEVQKLQFLPL